MRIYSKKILTTKQPEDVFHIFRESAYYSSYKFEQDTFSFKCVKRNQRGLRIVTPVKGYVVVGAEGTEVYLQLHAGLGVLLGMAIFTLGIMKALVNLFLPTMGMWPTGLATMAFGTLIAVFWGLREMETLDVLEHKLRQ